MAKITLLSTKRLSPGVSIFWFRSEDPIDYIAGQAAEFILPHDADERGQSRWFTLSSSPTENLIAITTRSSKSSFKKKLFSLEPGEELTILPSMGDFVLPRDKSLPIVFIAGGIGITPVRSIVKWLIDTGEKRDVQLIHIVSDEKDLLFHDLFNSYDIGVSNVLGRESINSILEKIGDPKQKLFYISGPTEFIESVRNYLRSNGIDPSKIVPDSFTGY